MSVPNNVSEGFFCFVKYTIRHQIKEEMTVPSPDYCSLCIPNMVVMGKDYFLSFVLFKDIFTYFYIVKVHPSNIYNFTRYC